MASNIDYLQSIQAKAKQIESFGSKLDSIDWLNSQLAEIAVWLDSTHCAVTEELLVRKDPVSAPKSAKDSELSRPRRKIKRA